MCKKCMQKNVLGFCFNLYLETYGLHYFLNRFAIFNQNFLAPLEHFYQEKFDSPYLSILF